jgi:hypothetical protein
LVPYTSTLQLEPARPRKSFAIAGVITTSISNRSCLVTWKTDLMKKSRLIGRMHSPISARADDLIETKRRRRTYASAHRNAVLIAIRIGQCEREKISRHPLRCDTCNGMFRDNECLMLDFKLIRPVSDLPLRCSPSAGTSSSS